MTRRPLRIATDTVVKDRWADAARGSIGWQTLLSAELTDSDSLVAGVATLDVGEDFSAHHHPQSEMYFGLQGSGAVVIDGVPHSLSPGVLLFIPGGAVHGIPMVNERLVFLYAFAADSFDEINYTFVDG